MKNLKSLRHIKNMTQAEVANELNISFQLYSHYENDRRKPDPEMLKKIANFFGVTIDYLLDIETHNYKKNMDLRFQKALEEKGITQDKFEILSQDKLDSLAIIIAEYIKNVQKK